MDYTHADIRDIVNELKNMQPGFLPYPLFKEIARIVALPILEIVPLRLHNGVVEVLMLKRGVDDDFWPNAMHTPGTVIRATDIVDGGIEPALNRIIEDELDGTQVSAPVFLCLDSRTSLRGAEQAQVYWVEVLDEPKTGVFFPVNELPDLIGTQVKFINEAISAFVNHKSINKRSA